MKHLTKFLVLGLGLSLVGCAHQPSNQPTFEVDKEQLSKAENNKKLNSHLAHVVWLNPPLRRVESPVAHETPQE
jgi:hypothetical protein